MLEKEFKQLAELSDDVYQDLMALCKDGDDLLNNSQYPEALAKYQEAWGGQCYFELHDLSKALASHY